MTATARRAASVAPAPIPIRSRLYGLGSVFAKTLRDSRLAVIIVAGLTGGLLFVVSSAVGQVFPSLEARAEVARLANDMQRHRRRHRRQAAQRRTPWVATSSGSTARCSRSSRACGRSSALSGTLAAEARRGSLELIVVTSLASPSPGPREGHRTPRRHGHRGHGHGARGLTRQQRRSGPCRSTTSHSTLPCRMPSGSASSRSCSARSHSPCRSSSGGAPVPASPVPSCSRAGSCPTSRRPSRGSRPSRT